MWGAHTLSLVEADRFRAKAYLESFEELDTESPLKIHLLQGVSRGKKMDIVVQKGVELGVATFAPVLTSRCGVSLSESRAASKADHWEAVAISAAEQCGRAVVPVVEQPQHLALALRSWQERCPKAPKFLLEPLATDSLRTALRRREVRKCEELLLLVGPEGGLSAEELDRARNEFGWQPVSVGPRTMRTETAGLAAVVVAQTLLGDL